MAHDDSLLTDAEVEALIAPFRPAYRTGVDRYEPLTLQAHRALNLSRPVTDTFHERPARVTDVIVVRPPALPRSRQEPCRAVPVEQPVEVWRVLRAAALAESWVLRTDGPHP
jgi:hypothetical protein